MYELAELKIVPAADMPGATTGRKPATIEIKQPIPPRAPESEDPSTGSGKKSAMFQVSRAITPSASDNAVY